MVIPVLKTVELLVVTRLDLPDRKEDILALQLGRVDIQVDNQDFQARLREASIHLLPQVLAIQVHLKAILQ